MAIVSRTEFAMPTDTVQLTVQFRGPDGLPVDLDTFPELTVIQPSGAITLSATSIGVSRIGIGQYNFDYSVGFTGPLGVWTDYWTGTLGGIGVNQTLNFVITNTQLPAINTDGYVHLGDDPGFNFSQLAIMNINKIMKKLRARLNSSGKSATVDEFGNEIFVDCDIFTVDQLTTFICNALSSFNQIPHFTAFTFEDTEIMDLFCEVLVQHAHLTAMASKALIERGREFNITDNGLAFQPPGVSDILNTQYQTELSNWYEKVKLIKHNMKPAALGLGTLRPLAASPQFLRLRHLRARQII